MRKIILINIHNLWKRNVYKTYFLACIPALYNKLALLANNIEQLYK